MESGDVGVELTSFTKKDATVDESREEKSDQTEGSHDHLDDKSEPTADTETGQVRSKEVSQLHCIHQMAKHL